MCRIAPFGGIGLGRRVVRVMGGWRTSRVLAVLMAAGVVVPTVAWAGTRVIAGQQSLQIKVTLKPNRAGARG